MSTLYDRIHGTAPDRGPVDSTPAIPCSGTLRHPLYPAHADPCACPCHAPVQSPFVRRALARELPAKDLRGNGGAY